MLQKTFLHRTEHERTLQWKGQHKVVCRDGEHGFHYPAGLLYPMFPTVYGLDGWNQTEIFNSLTFVQGIGILGEGHLCV